MFMLNLHYRRFWDWTYPLYAMALFLLFLVFALGVVRLGAQRWLRIAWFNFQPSEFAKLILAIFLARYFSKKSVDDVSVLSKRFGIFRGIILPFIFVSIPMLLIIEQPDLGSGMILFLLFMTLLLRAGALAAPVDIVEERTVGPSLGQDNIDKGAPIQTQAWKAQYFLGRMMLR